MTPYPKAFDYVIHLHDVCWSANLAMPVGLIIDNDDFDDFRAWAIPFIGPVGCMLKSGNLIIWDGMELHRQHPIYPPEDTSDEDFGTCLWCQQSMILETAVGACCWEGWKQEATAQLTTNAALSARVEALEDEAGTCLAALKRCASAAGNPDPARGCRIVIYYVTEVTENFPHGLAAHDERVLSTLEEPK